MLTEPGPALTDLALGVVGVALAAGLTRVPGVNRHWRTAIRWVAFAALAGAVHHGFVVRSRWAALSWAAISAMVVVAVSYLLAASVAMLLPPRRGRPLLVLRGATLVGYAAIAVTGRASVTAILVCEGATMAAIVGLWVVAAARRHPNAPWVLGAMLASAAAAGLRAVPSEHTAWTGLDPTSLYHLGQIPGILLLGVAVVPRGGVRAAAASARIRPEIAEDGRASAGTGGFRGVPPA